MKIAFTGSHSTGKTTLLNDLITYFGDDINIKCITEVARKIIHKGGFNNEKKIGIGGRCRRTFFDYVYTCICNDTGSGRTSRMGAG